MSAEVLAQQVGVSRQTIHNYESSNTLADSGTLARLATALKVRLEDLLRSPGSVPAFHFRGHAAVRESPQVQAHATRWLENYLLVERAVGASPYAPETSPCHSLEDGGRERVRAAAARFRQAHGLGDGPILNLFASVEEIGMKVLRQPLSEAKCSGLSACSMAEGAFVLVNADPGITIERQLFTLSHEIGHLIFHRDEYGDQLLSSSDSADEQAREEVADYFAVELLVPEASLRREMEAVRSVIRLKQHFRVSYQTILKRIEDLGGASYGAAFAKIAAEHRRRTGRSLSKSAELEPRLTEVDFPPNERFRRLAVRALEQEKLTEHRAAELMGVTVPELRLLRRADAEYVTL